MLGLFLGAGHRSRRWDVEKFAKTARLLSDRKVAVLLGPEERDLRPGLQAKFGDAAALIEELPLDVFFAFLTKLDVIVTGDTGPMHLAAAAGAGIVMLSQAGAPDIFDPLAERLTVLRQTTLDALAPADVAAAVDSLSQPHK